MVVCFLLFESKNVAKNLMPQAEQSWKLGHLVSRTGLEEELLHLFEDLHFPQGKVGNRTITDDLSLFTREEKRHGADSGSGALTRRPWGVSDHEAPGKPRRFMRPAARS